MPRYVITQICNQPKDKYPMGFNGQMKDNEIAGIGNHTTARDWEYDTRLGRRWNRDPLSAAMPGWSSYVMGLDNPILNVDKDGDFPYKFHIRSFAPFKTFGGGFAGDYRGFSTVLSNRELVINGGGVTSRLQQMFTVDPSARTMSGGKPWSDPSHHPFLGSKTANDDRGSAKATFGASSTVGISAVMAGANPLTKPGPTPDIDIKSSIYLKEDLENGVLSVNGAMKGDRFPSAEMFIGDSKGQQIMVGTSGYEGNPFVSLPGDNNRPMGGNLLNIKINDKGEFQYIIQGNKQISIKDWNNRQKSQPVGYEKQESTPGTAPMQRPVYGPQQ